MNTRFDIAVAIAVVAAIVLIITLPTALNELRETNVVPSEDKEDEEENLSAEEQYDRFKEKQSREENVRLLNRALSSEQKTLCDDITNSTLRRRCHNELPEYKNETTVKESSNYTSVDIDLFNRALSTGNQAICEDITAEELRNRCQERISS